MYQRCLRVLLVLFFGSILSGFIMHDPEDHSREDIRAVVRGVAAAWEEGDTAAFRKYYSSDKEARIIEGGGQHIGVDDLIERHVLPEHQELEELNITINGTEIHLVNGSSTAWAIQDFDVHIKTKDGKESKVTGYETFILQRFNGKWKIVHSHSSTRQLKSQTK